MRSAAAPGVTGYASLTPLDPQTMSTIPGTMGPGLFKDGPNEVIEVPLLLSTRRVEELIALSRRKGTSVAQILRQLIDQALAAEGRTL